MPLVFESGEELETLFQDKDFKLLNEDFYVLQVESVEVQPGKTSQWQPEPHDEWKVRFDVVSFQNGEPIYYQDGSEPEADRQVRLTTFINPTKKGMVPRPSKARKFLTASMGLDVAARIELDSVEDLVGKRMIGRVIHKSDGKGIVRDRLEDFTAIRSRPARPAPVATTAEVESDASDLLAKAKEIFGDDLKA